jgi:hypothetical protein
VVRDMWERAMGFAEYVALYGLARSEGLVLRYLSDAYRALDQSVPEDTKSDELIDMIEWLGELVRQVDSSLLDEWELLSHPEAVDAAAAVAAAAAVNPVAAVAPAAGMPAPVTSKVRAFNVMVRNAAFRRVELLARRDFAGLGELDGHSGWDKVRWAEAARAYFAEHDSVGVGSEARSGERFISVASSPRCWQITQVIDDPAGYGEWVLRFAVDLDASDEVGEPALAVTAFERR